MKTGIALLFVLVSLPAFAKSHCPLSAAITAAEEQFREDNFGENGAETKASYERTTNKNKEEFFVTIDGRDGGNPITEYVVYLAPETCKPTDTPKAI